MGGIRRTVTGIGPQGVATSAEGVCAGDDDRSGLFRAAMAMGSTLPETMAVLIADIGWRAALTHLTEARSLIAETMALPAHLGGATRRSELVGAFAVCLKRAGTDKIPELAEIALRTGVHPASVIMRAYPMRGAPSRKAGMGFLKLAGVPKDMRERYMWGGTGDTLYLRHMSPKGITPRWRVDGIFLDAGVQLPDKVTPDMRFPARLDIGGDLAIGTDGASLPLLQAKSLRVGGSASLSWTTAETLPQIVDVAYNLFLSVSGIRMLPSDLRVGRDLSIIDCPNWDGRIPESAVIGGKIHTDSHRYGEGIPLARWRELHPNGERA
jgi:hypothetical protein